MKIQLRRVVFGPLFLYARKGDVLHKYVEDGYDIRGKKYLETSDKFYMCDTGMRYAMRKKCPKNTYEGIEVYDITDWLLSIL